MVSPFLYDFISIAKPIIFMHLVWLDGNRGFNKKSILVVLLTITLLGCSSVNILSKNTPAQTYFQGQDLTMAAAINQQNTSEIVRLIKEQGYDVNTKGNTKHRGSDYRWSFLNYAVRQNKLKSAQTLLKLGADVNALAHVGTMTTGYSNMNIAAENGDTAMIKLLLQHNINLNNKRAESPLQDLIIYHENKTDLFDLLIQNGADVNHPNYISSSTPLMSAYDINNLLLVDYLLAKGADPLQIGFGGHSFASSLQMNLEQNRKVQIAQKYKQRLIAEYGIKYPITVSFGKGLEQSIKRYETATREEKRLMGEVELKRINNFKAALKTGSYKGVSLD